MTRAMDRVCGAGRRCEGRFSHIHVKGLCCAGLEASVRADGPTFGRVLPRKSQRQRGVVPEDAGLTDEAGAADAGPADAGGEPVLAAGTALVELAEAVAAGAGCAFCHASRSAASYQCPACFTIGHSPLSGRPASFMSSLMVAWVPSFPVALTSAVSRLLARSSP